MIDINKFPERLRNALWMDKAWCLKIEMVVRKVVASIPSILKIICKDTKGVIRNPISRKDRQHNGQKRANNDLQNTTLKIKDRSSNTNPTKTQGELKCSGRVGSSCSTSGTRCVTLVTNLAVVHEWIRTWNCFRQMYIMPYLFCQKPWRSPQETTSSAFNKKRHGIIHKTPKLYRKRWNILFNILCCKIVILTMILLQSKIILITIFYSHF